MFLCFLCFNSFLLPTRHHTPTDNYKQMKTKLIPTLSILWYLKFYVFTILHFYNFTLVIDTTVQNNDNEISLHFKPMIVLYVNYSV